MGLLRVLLALAALAARVAADDRQAAWIADQRDGTGKQGWRAALGSVDVSCQFAARIGTKALVFETADGRFAFTANEASGAAFATTPRLCRFAGGAAPADTPALVLAAP